MRNKAIYLLALGAILASCGGESNDVESKKEQLTQYKAEVKDLNSKIAQLQKEISTLDTAFKGSTPAVNAVLVNTKPAEVKDFTHKIEVRGEVKSRRNVLLSSEIGGKIESVKVREGQHVSAGQVLVALDADIIRNNVAELKTALELANAVYERQANLWKKNIGTEIQYLEAKNKKESLERKLSTAYSQLDQAIIKAPFSGVVDEVPAREGEMASPGNPLVRLVNPGAMYIDADVSERYVGDFKKGDKVELYFPVQEKNVASTVSAVSEVLNPENRTFSVEVQLPEVGFDPKPNQVVILQLVDYHAKDAVVVPTEIILSDKEGKYLFTTEDKNGNTIAKKTRVEIGKTQDGLTEIIAGVDGTDKVITAGFRTLSDGVQVKPVDRSTETAQL